MSPSTPDRRTFLETLVAAGALSLAGCSSDDEETTATETTEPDETPGTDTSPGTETPDEPTPGDEVDVEALKSAARTLVTRWANEEYEAMREPFTERMRGAITVDELRGLWKQLVTDKGAFVSVTGAEHTTSQGYDVVVLTGQFTEGQQRFVVSFDEAGRVAGLQVPPPAGEYQPPAYVDRSAFTEREVSLQATDSCSLGATLTMPDGEGSVPGVVLVHGSGAHGRDETIGPNKPFRDLAWGLASRGVAVLRYDKRTAVCSVTEPTLDSVVTDDALAAVDVLRNADRVAAGDVVVVGHSLGGMVAPRIAARDESLAGIAMLAAPARPLADLVVVQNEYLADLDGTVTEAEREYLEDLRQQMERAQSGNMGPDETVLGQGRSWWNSLGAYDQVGTADGLSLPLFLLQGGRDYQVDPEADFGRWRDALDGRDSVRFEAYPSLDHLFMPGEEPSRPADYYEQDNVAETVVTDLAGWIDGVAADPESE